LWGVAWKCLEDGLPNEITCLSSSKTRDDWICIDNLKVEFSAWLFNFLKDGKAFVQHVEQAAVWDFGCMLHLTLEQQITLQSVCSFGSA